MVQIARGLPSVGLSNATIEDPTLPPISEATPPGEIIDYLVERLNELTVLVEGKADRDQIRTEIAYNDEGIKIAANEIVLFGGVTLGAFVDDQRGAGDGSIDITLTRIIGNRIQTGIITSNNWGAAEGTAFDLDNETLTLGGSSSPKLYYDGAGNLTITGTLQAGSIISTTATINGTNVGDIESHVGETGNPHNTSLDVITGDLDDISDGSTYFRSTSSQNTGGTRAVNALDSGYDYIRTISTTKIAISGSNPTNGVILDSAGLRMYDGGAIQIDLPSNGSPATFSGDIVTSGQVVASGTSSAYGYTASIVANPGASNGTAILGQSQDTGGAIEGYNIGAGAHYGVFGIANGSGSNGAGVSGQGLTGSGADGARFLSLGSGIALRTTFGDVQIDNDVNIDGTLDVNLATTITDDLDVTGDLDVGGTAYVDGLQVDGSSTLNGALTVQGNNDISVDRSLYVATDAASGDSSIVIGSSSGQTGKNTLVFKEGAAGSLVANEFHFYGALSADSDTTIGIVSEQVPTTSGAGSPSPTHRVPIFWNTGEYWLYLEAR